MSTIVDLRLRRIEACCARAIGTAGDAPLAPSRPAPGPDGADIILFPKPKPKSKRPRKSLKRRFSAREV